ncbi:hypothetical protein NSND_50582 [Nitrospira sp. ND1]|nr:hypothetical protein NSND_50582 [Nitrospira sp. ND1]
MYWIPSHENPPLYTLGLSTPTEQPALGANDRAERPKSFSTKNDQLDLEQVEKTQDGRIKCEARWCSSEAVETNCLRGKDT